MVAVGTPVRAQTAAHNLRVTVPVTCEVSYRPSQSNAATVGPVMLGHLNEYCNAARGYELIVHYAPGTLRGAVLAVGGDQVVLNGSGEAVISRAAGARSRNRELLAQPGNAGFDTDRLSFRVLPL
ncbi:MAG: hypothetical protein KF780_08985 [Sphingomonas sp.]|nr:hypothetical protein [Sphingomonas sp.]